MSSSTACCLCARLLRGLRAAAIYSCVRSSASILAGGIGAVALLLPACSQGEGGRCEINNDCGDDLMCEKGTGTDGVCVRVGSTTARLDAAPSTTPAADAGPDAAASIDGASGDASSGDAAVDAAAVDAASADTSASDAATDAGAADKIGDATADATVG